MTNVAIVGAGPAGLLAAWGVQEEQIASGRKGPLTIDIFDPAWPGIDVNSRVLGLQYLHEPCGLDFAARRIQLRYDLYPKTWISMGDAKIGFIESPEAPPNTIYWLDERASAEVRKREYNRKLGRPLDEENSTRFISQDPVTVWSLKDAYAYLLTTFKHNIRRREVRWAQVMGELADRYDVVICTAPLPKMFPMLDFPLRWCWIATDYSPVEDHPQNTCYYNLSPKDNWFRSTYLYGSKVTEFIDKPEYEWSLKTVSVSQMKKVAGGGPAISAYRPNVILAGRWGTWDPKELTHHAYRKGRDAIARLV